MALMDRARSAVDRLMANKALRWVLKHRRKVYGALALVISLASRYVPAFPSRVVLQVLKVLLGV